MVKTRNGSGDGRSPRPGLAALSGLVLLIFCTGFTVGKWTITETDNIEELGRHRERGKERELVEVIGRHPEIARLWILAAWPEASLSGIALTLLTMWLRRGGQLTKLKEKLDESQVKK